MVCIGYCGTFANQITVGIAQLVRALDCGSRGRRFEPDYPPELKYDKSLSVMGGFFYTEGESPVISND